MTEKAVYAEMAIMGECRRLIPERMETPEMEQQVRHRFRIWADHLSGNKAVLKDVEAHAVDIADPVWLAQVRGLAVEFCKWLATP